MTHADAFLREIIAHPDDDAPRLIFADWLEEQGDANSVARAEFIRVQCALAAGTLPKQRRADLDRRQQQLLDEWAEEWVHPIRRLIETWEFHRGFISSVGVLEDRFLMHAGQLFRRAPIQRLSLRVRLYEFYPSLGRSPNLAALSENKHLCRLRSLDLAENQLESRDVRALVVSKYLANLSELNLSYNRIGDGGIRALAGSSLLGQLVYLSLRGNDIGAGGLRVLADALEKLSRPPEESRLQRLELSHHGLSAAGQRVIAESPLLRRLVRV